MAIINGTPENDDLDGTNDDDVISGGDGNDNIFGGEGDDSLYGEDGNDLISGWRGNDLIDGGAGRDNLFGLTGDDEIYGGSGNDVIRPGQGDDIVFAGSDDDFVFYEFGNDTLDGGTGTDRLVAELVEIGVVALGDVSFDAGTGTLTSGFGTVSFSNFESYFVSTEGGNDTLIGGTGNDDFRSAGGNDILIGGEGNDSLLTIAGDNRLDGGAGNDYLVAGAGNDLILGGDGDDIVSTSGGSDQISGGDGFDSLAYGFGGTPTDDAVDLDPDAGTLVIGGAVSTIAGFERFSFSTGEGDDSLIGGAAYDLFFSSGGNNYIEARGGDDTISTAGGNSVIFAGDGNDRIDAGEGNDVIDAGAGDDFILHRGGADTIDGGDGTDYLVFTLTNFAEPQSPDAVILDQDRSLFQVGDVISTINNVEQFSVSTGTGDDVLIGGLGNDNFNSFAGDDWLEGRGGNDWLFAYSGSDYVDGGDGNDFIRVNVDGNDVMLGGAGTDRIDYLSSSTYVPGDPIEAIIDGGAGNDTANIFLTFVEQDITIDAASGSITWDGGNIEIAGIETLGVGSGSGNDVFIATADSALWNGGEGIDEMILPGSYLDYELTTFQAGAVAYFQNGAGTIYAARAEFFTFDDGVFDLATGTFTPTVVTNIAPDALDDNASADEDASTSGNVLTNDSDADGDALEVVTVNGLPVGTPIVGLYGTLTLSADGSYSYTADQPGADRLADGTTADDVFTYEVSDGEDTSTATLTITVSAVADGRFVVGTEQDDVLPGADLNDVVEGLGGNDRLLGGDGDDLLDGGTGHDYLNGGDDDDTLLGGAGNDVLFGNDGDDILIGGDGDDLLIGHEGADVFVVGGDAGSHDTIRDFEIGVDGLEFANDASIIAVLEASRSTTLSLSDGSSVTLNGISSEDLADILEPLVGEQQIENLVSLFSDSEAPGGNAIPNPAAQSTPLDLSIEPVLIGSFAPVPDLMSEQVADLSGIV